MPSNEETCSGIAARLQPTIGEVVYSKAKALAAIVAERALTKDWKEHPLFGIAVDTDRWALEYQRELFEIEDLLNLDMD